MRRIAVTGVGVVSPVGIGVEPMWDSLMAGRSGIRPITAFDISAFPVRFGGYIDEFDPEPVIDAKAARRMSRFQHFAMVAADEAMRDAGLTEIDEALAVRAGCIVGSGIGGLGTMEEQNAILLERGPSRVSPFFIPGTITAQCAFSRRSCGMPLSGVAITSFIASPY